MHTTAAVADLRAQTADGIRVACGRLDVRLDDGRTVQSPHHDLLASVTDLAERRAVLDGERALLLDPLPCSDGVQVVLQVRLATSGAEIGVCTGTGAALDDALRRAWQHLHDFARRTHDDALLDELLLPHPEHYSPRLLAAQPLSPV